ncbi:MAG TPA: AMP-binding protein [Solirubrobacteraceae bacterium]|nr:AMP-binding protein [Solirubrobacteraceae bacterium]
MSFWIHAASARRPDRIAVEGPERRLTYAELAAAVTAKARVLAADGVAAGDRYPLPFEDPCEYVVTLHACVGLGAAVVPIDLRLSAAERAARAVAGRVVFPGTVAVLHTSGTTSAPKPVELSAANFLASALGSAVALGLDLDERWLCPMPLTHVGGLSIPIRSVIYGTTGVLHGRFDTEAVLAELMNHERRITIVSLVPTMLARLLDAGLQRPPTLRWALLGGGPIAPALLARAEAAGVPVAPTYGMTEACSQIATFGWPLPGVDVTLSAAEEIFVRGPIVSPGSVDDDGWLHTGDLGELDDLDRLRIIGRKADTIVTGGENVAPAEVEAALLEHPDVVDAGVFARPDPEWGEAIVATIVARPGASPTADALGEFVGARLARFKVPKAFEFATELPRTASGKLLRRQLADVGAARP